MDLPSYDFWSLLQGERVTAIAEDKAKGKDKDPRKNKLVISHGFWFSGSMKHAGVIPTLRSKYETLQPFLNERVRRLWSATEAMGLGHGGIAALTEATGMSRTTISSAIQEIQDLRESPGSLLPVPRSRRPGPAGNGSSNRIRPC